MKSRKTIVLLIIFFALLSYVYLFEFKERGFKENKKDMQQNVLVLNKDSVVGLEFKPSQFYLKKIDPEWKICFPVDTKADEAEIDQILSSLENLKIERVVAESRGNMARYGLSPFQAAMVLAFKDVTSDTLFIGTKNLDGRMVFYRKSGETRINLTTAELLNLAERSLFQLRDKSIIRFNKEKVTHIEVNKKYADNIRLKKISDHWEIEQPVSAKCEQHRVDELLDLLVNTQVTAFVSEKADDLTPFGLKNPWLTFSIDDSSEVLHTLYLGERQNGCYYAKNESAPAIFKIDSSLVRKLNVNVFDLRSKTIVNVDTDSVTEIIIRYPGFMLQCQKNQNFNWIMISPDLGEVEAWKVQSLLFDINSLKVTQFLKEPYLGDKFYGFDTPCMEVILKKNNDLLADLSFGKQNGEDIYIKNKLTHHTYKVKVEAKNKLILNWKEFKKKDDL